MPPSNRPPGDDPGFEVVGDAKPPAAKPLPPKPPAARSLPPKAPAAPAAKPLPPKPPAAKSLPPAAPPAAAKSPPPGPKKPAVTLLDDDEDDRPKKKTKARIVDDDEDDDQPRKKKAKARVIDDDDEDTVEGRIVDDDTVEEDRPRKKKKKKKKGGHQISDENLSFMETWGAPLFLMLIGLVMLMVGTWRAHSGPDALFSPGPLVAIRVIYELITIPISIVMLMLIGSVMGIEYGTIGMAVRGLAAIGLMMSGLDAVLDWLGLAMFVARPLIFMISLGMMMTFFKLDVNEAIITIVGMNILSFLFGVLLFAAVIIVVLGSSRRDSQDYDADEFDSSDQPGLIDGGFDEDPDDEPMPKRKRGGAKNREKQNQNPPVNNQPLNDGDDGLGLVLPPPHAAPGVALAADPARPAVIDRRGWLPRRPDGVVVFAATCPA